MGGYYLSTLVCIYSSWKTVWTLQWLFSWFLGLGLMDAYNYDVSHFNDMFPQLYPLLQLKPSIVHRFFVFDIDIAKNPLSCGQWIDDPTL